MLVVTHMGIQPWKLGPRLAGAESRDRRAGLTAISGTPDGPACSQQCSKNARTGRDLRGQWVSPCLKWKLLPALPPRHLVSDQSCLVQPAGGEGHSCPCVSPWSGLRTGCLFKLVAEGVRVSASTFGTSFPNSSRPGPGEKGLIDLLDRFRSFPCFSSVEVSLECLQIKKG